MREVDQVWWLRVDHGMEVGAAAGDGVVVDREVGVPLRGQHLELPHVGRVERALRAVVMDHHGPDRLEREAVEIA